MLDTVILKIPKGSYRVLRKESFTLATAKQNKGFIFRKWINNGSDEDRQKGIYRPRLTIEQRGQDVPLKIEFSAQWLLFKNGLQETDESRFDETLEALKQSILDMDVLIDKSVLQHAEVRSIHPAKNILITGGYSAMGIIREISKVNLTEKMDLTSTQFRNGGHGVQFRAESHTLTFYDKNKDLEKGDKKAYDSHQKLPQPSLFDYMEQKRKPEVLRMEVRLSEKQKMNSVLKKLGFGINPTFADIFKNEVCQKILLDYFATYIEPNLFIFDFEDSPQGILRNILRKSKIIKIDEAMKLAALKVFCKDEGGVRGLRNIIELKAGRRKWQYIAPKFKTLNQKIGIGTCHDYIQQIRRSLQKFKPYKPQMAKRLSTSYVHNSPVS